MLSPSSSQFAARTGAQELRLETPISSQAGRVS